MGHELFTYKINKKNDVRIFWQNHGVKKCIKTIGGKRGEELANELADAGEEETQYILQRITGNFKRGNEREHSKSKR